MKKVSKLFIPFHDNIINLPKATELCWDGTFSHSISNN